MGIKTAFERKNSKCNSRYNITDDEIESVQQAALWYFTNYGEENDKYNKYDCVIFVFHQLAIKSVVNVEKVNPAEIIEYVI